MERIHTSEQTKISISWRLHVGLYVARGKEKGEKRRSAKHAQQFGAQTDERNANDIVMMVCMYFLSLTTGTVQERIKLAGERLPVCAHYVRSGE